jgi:predicted lipid-binding transport protein (Tim44 family)
VLRLAVSLALLGVAAEAFARVGGGHGFSSGGHSSGGGGGGRGFSSGGGDGGGGGELLYLLIRLCIEYPAIGVPVLVVVVLFVIMNSREQRMIRRDLSWQPPTEHLPIRSSGWAALANTDPALSEPVFLDFVQLVFRRAYAATPSGPWEPLAPFVSEDARVKLMANARDTTRYDDVVVASTTIERTMTRGGQDEVTVAITSSRLEHTPQGPQSFYNEERWVFARAAGARSLAPDAAIRLGCPSCGAAIQCDRMGACTNCGTPITAGQLQWQVRSVDATQRRPITAPEVSFFNGGEEPSYRQPNVLAPDLAVQLRAFHGRHPTFDSKEFQRRATYAFTSLQSAWDAGRWDDARPFVTDSAWGTLRFWLDRYKAGGLRNRLADVHVERMQVVKVTLDAWYESVTVRFWASSKDWVEDSRGKVVGGNKDRDRKFSEYWTFVRAIGSGDKSADPAHCPSCGAPLDKVNAAGKCGYCDTVITTGKFDWVLSRIDQTEVYRG